MSKDWKPQWNGTDWQVDFYFGGRRFRQRLGVRDPDRGKEARAIAKAIYDRAIADHLSPKPAGTLFYRAAKSYAEAGGETRFLPRIMQHFGPDMLIEDIGEVEITECGLALYPDAAEDTRRRQVRVPIRAIIRYAAGIRRQKRQDNTRTRWLTPEEAERLIEAADAHILPKIAFLIGSGCRTGELIGLDMADVNIATRQAFIRDPKNGDERWMRMVPRAFEMITWPEQGPAFLTPKGKGYKSRSGGGGQIQAAFNKARDRSGLGPDVTPHILRHTWATWYYAATHDFGGLMDLGGWKRSDMANRYRKIAPDDLAERLEAHGWQFGARPGPDLRIAHSA